MLRRGLSLLLAFLLLFAGWSGSARASAMVQDAAGAAVSQVSQPVCGSAEIPAEGPCRSELPAAPVEAPGQVELAELLCLPVDLGTAAFGPRVHLRPYPVLETGHPAPCLAGLLRPPSRGA